MFPLQAISAFTQINCGVIHKERWFYSLLQAVLSHPRWVDEVGLTCQPVIQLVTPILPLFSSVGWWGSKRTWKTDPSACPCLAEATSITLRRGGWKAGVSMAPCPKLSWHLLHHQPRWWMHIQELPSHRQELAQGLPLAHPWIPAVLREKKPPRILQFKFIYVMSRAKCHKAWDCLLSHHL